MKLILLFSFLSCSILSCKGLFDPVTRINKPHVESYWESWDLPGNYAANLSALPISPIGSLSGVNVVNLAFADTQVVTEWDCMASPDCITSGFEMNDSAALREAVKTIHAAGGFVKMAFGGETYGNPGEGLTTDDVKQLVERIYSLVEEYNLDGVDITTINSCSYNTPCPYTDNQIYMIERLRTLMPYKIISYTFPHSPNNPTFSKVITQSIDNLDYVSTSIGELSDIQSLIDMKVPNYKIVWGHILTWSHGHDYDACNLEFTVAAARFVKANNLGGMMTWSLNSDTYQRNNDEAGACTDYQTGHPDAAFINSISYILNHD